MTSDFVGSPIQTRRADGLAPERVIISMIMSAANKGYEVWIPHLQPFAMP